MRRAEVEGMGNLTSSESRRRFVSFSTAIAEFQDSKVFRKEKVVMTVLDFVILLVVAGVCGALGQAIVGYSRGGCLASIAVGFIGAVLGAWIPRSLGLPEMISLVIGDQPFPIIWSILGSALFVAVIARITPRPRAGWYRRRTW
jgi:uncharacterized membrane protein YeaQ/YmgE (transglycosylase-associated protein family)